MGGKWAKLFYFLGRFCIIPEKLETNEAEIVLFFRFYGGTECADRGGLYLFGHRKTGV